MLYMEVLPENLCEENNEIVEVEEETIKCRYPQCDKEAIENELFCEEHVPEELPNIENHEALVEKKVADEKSTALAVNGLLSLHLSAYMLIESLSDNFPGLKQQFKEDIEEIKIGYESIIDEYGLETINEYVGPATFLLSVTAKHFIVANINKKKQESLKQ